MRWTLAPILLLTSCSFENPKMANPIVHDPPGGMPEKTYEYTLPITESTVPAEHKAMLTPWFERFLNKTPSEIKKQLSTDWNEFSAKGAVTFRNYLLTLSPKSIVIDGDRVWLALHSDANIIMIHEPRNLSQADSKFIREFNAPSLEIFCTHFFESYEDVTPYANAISMSLKPISNDDFAKSGDWVNGVYLYYICNGDGILLAPDGKVGRWCHEIGWNDAPGYNRSCAVEQCFESFDQFIVNYVEYAQMDYAERKTTVFR